MATSGSKSIQFTNYDTLVWSWQVTSLNPSTGKATIKWQADIVSGEHGAISSYTGKNWTMKLLEMYTTTEQNFNGTAYISIDNNTTKTIASGTFTIDHPVSTSFYTKVTFNLPLGITFNGKYIDAVRIEYNLYLDARPKGGVITAATSCTDEEKPTFSYSVDYLAVDRLEASLIASNLNGSYTVKRDIPKVSSGDYSFELTAEEKDSILNIFRTAVANDIKYSIKSYFGTNTTESTVTRTYTIVNANPVIAPVLTNNYDGGILSGDNSLTVTPNAQALKKATITSVKYTYDGKTSNSGNITDLITSPIVVTATDSRGLTVSQEVVVDMINYIKLTCNIESHQSGVLNNNTIDMTFDVKGNFYNGSFNDGGSPNTVTLEYRYKEGNGSWSNYIWQDITINGNSYSTSIKFNRAYQTSVTIEVKVNDARSQVIVSSGTVKLLPVFDWGEDDFNFNVPVTIQGGDVIYVVESGTSGIWTYRKWSDGTAECWGRSNISTAVQQIWGNMYASGALTAANKTFPFTFTAIPVVNASLSVNSAAAFLMPPGGTSYTTSTTQTGAFELARPTALADATFTINYYVRGKWK